jgi:CheY-like chemotaxis protein
VVEDDPALRALVQNLLERFGFNVLEADSGVSALAVWEQHGGAIDLLLTDIVMPEHLSGLKLAEKLREQRASLPIIFTSGYSAEVVGKGPQALEGASFLQKPYPVLQLIKTVRAALDRKPAAE